MTAERKPVAFGDLRAWVDALKSAGELRDVNAEADSNIELGTVMRLAQGAGHGPAIVFNTIKITPDRKRAAAASSAAASPRIAASP